MFLSQSKSQAAENMTHVIIMNIQNI